MPLVVSSCNVIDRPTSFTATKTTRPEGGTVVTINNINPALNTGHVVAEMSILRYAVNAYVIGTTTAGEPGRGRGRLGDDNNWQSPQLLLPGITAMNISYGYVSNCAPSGAAASDVSRETFTFTNALDDKQNPPTPALIRITLNGNTLAAQGKDMESAASRTDAGNVYVYNIEATLRGGNTCADRSI
jgi:type IV pilus assembly protein PilW